MLVYRLCRSPFKALDGEGARLYGGRWNSAGRAVVYTSSSRALAALEYLLHVDPVDVPADLVMLQIDVADDLTRTVVDPMTLPKDWAEVTGSPDCEAIGDGWLTSGLTSLLVVPAAPIPEEFNVLINPTIANPGRVSVISERDFQFDPRLLG